MAVPGAGLHEDGAVLPRRLLPVLGPHAPPALRLLARPLVHLVTAQNNRNALLGHVLDNHDASHGLLNDNSRLCTGPSV